MRSPSGQGRGAALLLAGTLARDGRLEDGWLELSDGQIARVGGGDPPRAPDERATAIIAPGLCDLQLNGAGGHEFAADDGALDAIDAAALAHGVTSYLATLISPSDETARRLLPVLAERASDPSSPLAGVHVEGPFLNPARAGMHPVERLRSPAAGAPAWLESPAVRLVTLAPELPGALELIRRLSAGGATVALGHSEAGAETALEAIEAGATLVTHILNAMAPPAQRAPGLAGVAMVDERVHVTVIADGVHVAPQMLELVRRAAGPRALLVSDASPAAGGGPSTHRLAGVEIDRRSRTATGRLAGSTTMLDADLANWLAGTGASLAEAARAAGEGPAAAVGLPGGLVAGAPADLVLLAQDGRLERVMRGGHWLA